MNNIHTDDAVMDGRADILTARRTSVKLAEKPRILVAIPIGGKALSSILECPQCEDKFSVPSGFSAPFMLPAPFFTSHMNWVPPLNVSMAYAIKTGVRSPIARQIMTQEAIRLGSKYIFYVDDDTLIPPLGLYTLYNFMERNPHAGAVSGVYTTRENPNEPLIYKEHGAGCAWDFEMGPGARPEPIFGAGAGCLLARVESIKSWMEDNPDTPIWADEKDLPGGDNKQTVMWGHDIRFCRMLNMHGHPVYVDGRVLCGHYDIRSGQTYQVPSDAPGFEKTRQRLGNINTPEYWDQVYSREGADSWRKYPEMFQAVADAVPAGTGVTELGCGVGILGSKLTAEKGIFYKGFDISPTAIDMCHARFLDAEVLDVRDFTGTLAGDTVVMTELVEHLNRADAITLFGKLYDSPAKRIIFTTPDNCMGPDEVPEHTALFNSEYVIGLLKEALGDDLGDWNVAIDKADDAHLICVMER